MMRSAQRMRVWVVVCLLLFAGEVVCGGARVMWPVGQVELVESGGGGGEMLSVHAGVSGGSVVGEIDSALHVARLGQPVVGVSEGGGLRLAHGAIGVYSMQGGLGLPLHLFANAIDSSRVHLDWVDDVVGESGFEIERKVSGGAFEWIATVGPNEVAYDDFDVVGGGFYVYRIRAISTGMVGEYSNEAAAATHIEGDANGDGVVNIADLARLASRFGQMDVGWVDGDFNGDGIVNIADLAKLASNFGEVHAEWGKLADGTFYEATRYRIIDLGTLGGIESKALDVNDDLKVVGSSLTSDSRVHAFEWQNDVMVDLHPVDALSSRGYGVNEMGVVAGEHKLLSNLFAVGVWASGAFESFESLNEESIFGKGINDQGVIVGYAATRPVVNGGLVFRAFKIENEQMSWLVGDHGESNWALDINNKGVAGGYARVSDGLVSAALYVEGEVSYYNAYGSSHAVANALNEYSQLVGQADDEDGNAIATMWYRNEVLRLGTLGGATSMAMDVNEKGEVVGYGLDGNGQKRAFVFRRDGGMRDLNGLLERGDGWVLIDAMGVNNDGYIVGQGQIGDELHAYLLVPIVE